ncbi:dopamine D2-like receptor [Argopecten irradians]|uniref:dopamine D2-like receptor n=1 Tax=Argopecten irradians TaxID=31199 RepID=UPI0037237BD8
MGTTNKLNDTGLFDNSSAVLDGDSVFSPYYAVWLYNEKMFEANKVVMSFLIIMSVLGMFGNGSVVYIYSCRFRRNTMNYFILLLGISDVIGSIMLAFEAVDRRLPMYSGNLPVLCKLIRSIGNVVNIWSVGILVCIAFDRYYKICHPMKSFTMSKAKKMIIGVGVVGCIFAWPISVFHGPEKVPTGIPGVYGMDCADDDNYKDLLVRPLYLVALLVGNLVFFTIMVVLYALLYREIWKWKHKKVGEDINRIKSARSISAVSMFNTKHIHFSEADDVFTDHSENTRDLSELNGIALGMKHNEALKHHGVQLNRLDIPMTLKHSSSLESCHSLSSNGNTSDQHDRTEMYDKCDHGSKLNNSNQSGDDSLSSEVQGEEGGQLNLTFSSNESDRTDISSKHNGIHPISNGHVHDGLYVTCLTVRNTPDSSVHSTPQETDKIIITKSVNLSSDSPKPQRNGSTKFISVSTDSPKSRRNESVISHFSSISSAFRKRFSRNSNSSLKRRTPKSTASLAQSTMLFAVITTTFILSYVPFFIVELLSSTGCLDMNGDLPMSHKQILRLCNSSFCFNTAANPIIYSILNPAFKRQLKIIFLGEKRIPKKR